MSQKGAATSFRIRSTVSSIGRLGITCHAGLKSASVVFLPCFSTVSTC